MSEEFMNEDYLPWQESENVKEFKKTRLAYRAAKRLKNSIPVSGTKLSEALSEVHEFMDEQFSNLVQDEIAKAVYKVKNGKRGIYKIQDTLHILKREANY